MSVQGYIYPGIDDRSYKLLTMPLAKDNYASNYVYVIGDIALEVTSTYGANDQYKDMTVEILDNAELTIKITPGRLDFQMRGKFINYGILTLDNTASVVKGVNISGTLDNYGTIESFQYESYSEGGVLNNYGTINNLVTHGDVEGKITGNSAEKTTTKE